MMGEYFILKTFLTISCFVVTVKAEIKQSNSIHRHGCNYLNSNGTNLYLLSLKECKQECGVRPSCRAVDYFRREQKCALLLTDDGDSTIDSDRTCVHAKKEEMKDLNSLSCSDGEAYDTVTMSCVIKECSPFGVMPNVVVRGNMGQVGARLKTVCVPGYKDTAGRDTTVCVKNGEWNYRPVCNKIANTAANLSELERGCGIANTTEKSQATENDYGDANPTKQSVETECGSGIANTTEKSQATENDYGDANPTKQSVETECGSGIANTTEKSQATENDYGDANTTKQSVETQSGSGIANTTEKSQATESDRGIANTTEQSTIDGGIANTIGMSCTTDSACEETGSVCIDNKCFCSRLYRYNSTIKDCVKVCRNMTDKFKRHPSTNIRGYDLTTAKNDCKIGCKKNADCLSYEVTPKGCRFGSISYKMALDADSSLIQRTEKVELFSRTCI